MEFITLAIDVGSTRRTKARPHGGFGWACVSAAPEPRITSVGTDIEKCVAALSAALDTGLPVALGIEAPGWLPVPKSAGDVGCGRDGDRDRSCFAPAGGYVAALGMAQTAWVLRALAEHRNGPVPITARLEAWNPGNLLLWEAFVSGKAHASKDDNEAHVRDAATAAFEFVSVYRTRAASAVRIRKGDQVLSLFGSVLAWARAAGHAISEDEDLITEPLTVKPATMYTGIVTPSP